MEPNTIYNRFDSAHGWEQVDFRADRILQSAELNELQSIHNASACATGRRAVQ